MTFPTRTHVLSSAPVTRDYVSQFAVSGPLAEQWARLYANLKGPYNEKLHTCVAIPSQDVNGTMTAWYFVLSTNSNCNSYEAMIDLAREEWIRLGYTIGNVGELDQRRLEHALEASGERFFTVQVAAFSYRHPLREAHRGLPAWALTTAMQQPKALDETCVAVSALPPRVEEGDYEVIGYTCNEARAMRIYSHTRRTLLEPSLLDVRYLPEESFSTLRQTLVNKYPIAMLDERLDAIRNHWMVYLADIIGGRGR